MPVCGRHLWAPIGGIWGVKEERSAQKGLAQRPANTALRTSHFLAPVPGSHPPSPQRPPEGALSPQWGPPGLPPRGTSSRPPAATGTYTARLPLHCSLYSSHMGAHCSSHTKLLAVPGPLHGCALCLDSFPSFPQGLLPVPQAPTPAAHLVPSLPGLLGFPDTCLHCCFPLV